MNEPNEGAERPPSSAPETAKPESALKVVAFMLLFGLVLGWIFRLPRSPALDAGMASLVLLCGTAASVQIVRRKPRSQHGMAVVAMTSAIPTAWLCHRPWALYVAGALWLAVLFASIAGRIRLTIACIVLCGGVTAVLRAAPLSPFLWP